MSLITITSCDVCGGYIEKGTDYFIVYHRKKGSNANVSVSMSICDNCYNNKGIEPKIEG